MQGSILFQSTLPRRERRRANQYQKGECIFQSTLPRRERLGNCKAENCPLKFQSTLPRRERRTKSRTKSRRSTISIHTPTKGATTTTSKGTQVKSYFNPHSHEGSDLTARWADYCSIIISIHTPTKGATLLMLSQCMCELFQSTLPRRERLVSSFSFANVTNISIHTPTKGATLSNQLLL